MKKKNAIPKKALQVRRSRTGLGLFAAAPIPAGAKIEYTGKKITHEEAERRGGRYLFEINTKWTIDGNVPGNIARYINHSCKGNCESDTKGDRVFISTLRAIRPGEELLYDYGEEYFEEYIKPIGCACEPCSLKAQKAEQA